MIDRRKIGTSLLAAALLLGLLLAACSPVSGPTVNPMGGPAATGSDLNAAGATPQPLRKMPPTLPAGVQPHIAEVTPATAEDAAQNNGALAHPLPATPEPLAEPRIPQGPLPPGGVMPTDVQLPAGVVAAINHLAGRLQVPVKEVQVVQITPAEFPAGDLGCPSPKSTPRPIPALVTGLEITLQAGGETYVYHAHGSDIAVCAAPGTPANGK